MQDALPAVLQEPRGQHTPAPAALLEPDAQLTQDDEAATLYLPAGQDPHAVGDVLPTLGLNEPLAHGRHAVLDVPPVLGL